MLRLIADTRNVEDGTVYVPIRPICERIGVAWQPQARKLNNDPILAEALRSVTIRLQTSTGSTRPKTSQMLALPIEFLNGWLFGINANRVKDNIRDSLLRYQREVYRVLFEAFGQNQVTHRPDEALLEMLDSDDPLAIAYRHGMAIANLAREQLLLRTQFDGRLSSAETRLDAIEAELGNSERFITVTQTGELLDAIRAVGVVLTKITGSNSFGAVHGEFHRRFGLNSYKRLPAVKFEEAMNWLRQ